MHLCTEHPTALRHCSSLCTLQRRHEAAPGQAAIPWQSGHGIGDLCYTTFWEHMCLHRICSSHHGALAIFLFDSPLLGVPQGASGAGTERLARSSDRSEILSQAQVSTNMCLSLLMCATTFCAVQHAVQTLLSSVPHTCWGCTGMPVAYTLYKSHSQMWGGLQL